MTSARLIVDRDFVVGDIDRRLFGSFVEHMGRCVHTGIFEPGHPTADEHGLRQDVLALTRELGVSLVRYPGGNFMSGYDWEDGVGPHAQRPVRLDLAWYSTETNQFGTHEFMRWCAQAGVEPMLGVNLGTRGPDAARRYIEYCNHTGDTTLTRQRAADGAPAALDVRLWCLGNEMDGPWQIGQKTAAEYGRIAQETAKLMRAVDPRIELAACGSSAISLPTYGHWEDEVLSLCFDQVDYISLHTYFENPHDEIGEFLSQIEQTGRFIEEIIAVADSVAARRRSRKRLMLSFDEWNVWYKARGPEHLRQPGWPVAPRLIEEVYNVEDALLNAGALMAMLNRADRVRIACLAQLVNVIGPIMTEPGGPAWRQTIFHPFALMSRWARGRVLQARVRSDAYTVRSGQEIPYLMSCVTEDAARGECAVFVLNRHPTEAMDLTVELRGLGAQRQLVTALQLHHPDLKACNTREAPDRLSPQPLAGVRLDGECLHLRLQPCSWNVVVTSRVDQAVSPRA
jgi:alpha-N-arabinofuranosidase